MTVLLCQRLFVGSPSIYKPAVAALSATAEFAKFSAGGREVFHTVWVLKNLSPRSVITHPQPPKHRSHGSKFLAESLRGAVRGLRVLPLGGKICVGAGR